MSSPVNRTAPAVPSSTGASAFGVASLVMGIVGIFVLNVILGPLAIIFGAVGLNRANHAGGRGRGVSIAGIVLGVVALAVFAILLATAAHRGFVWHV
ncbi:DUF4190 domain-containing protein [Rhizomonospora bruguierae]|uniref:DUF4190 domain-containing protein n=1 Tax=Rhizomonospora bruguierae TaxID=1581705 RepID=UPI001BCB78DD|nr:DUF4190 domain-containing protein [Micromonospora sp. NBRC 107566]